MPIWGEVFRQPEEGKHVEETGAIGRILALAITSSPFRKSRNMKELDVWVGMVGSSIVSRGEAPPWQSLRDPQGRLPCPQDPQGPHQPQGPLGPPGPPGPPA